MPGMAMLIQVKDPQARHHPVCLGLHGARLRCLVVQSYSVPA
jgi:hypothetical protein